MLISNYLLFRRKISKQQIKREEKLLYFSGETGRVKLMLS